MRCSRFLIFLVRLVSCVAVAEEGLQGLRGSRIIEGREAAEKKKEPTPIVLDRPFVLQKHFDLSGDVTDNFDVEVITDAEMTHSCSNYVDDGTTVFTRNGSLVLKVSGACPEGGCLKSGRVMSKEEFRYGVFVFKATVPKCNYVWPAMWLLPSSSKGDGHYGTWPCSGEIDVLETVHEDAWGAFNLVAGFGAHEHPDGFCAAPEEPACSCSAPGYCTSTTLQEMRDSFYYVEEVNCSDAGPSSWSQHTFVLYWQPNLIATWVDPVLSFDESGYLVDIRTGQETKEMEIWNETMDIPSWKSYERLATPTWAQVNTFMEQCFPDSGEDAPFDKDFKIVLNIAVGGYGGAPCIWNSENCTTVCGDAVGSELVISELEVYQRM